MSKVFCALALIIVIATPSFSSAQTTDDLEVRKTHAYQLFHQGKIKQAVSTLQAVIRAASDPIKRAVIQRDLLEFCAFGHDWNCVGRTIEEMLPTLKSDQRLLNLYPEVILYETRLNRWIGNESYVPGLLKGTFFNIANPATHPSAIAELQIALAEYHAEKNDIRASEENLSAAILGLLLTNPDNLYSIGKVLVLLVDALVEGHDIVGAFTLATLVDDFVAKTVPKTSVLYAHHRMTIGQLLSFTNAHAATASTFEEAAALYSQLEMDEEVKNYREATAINYATAAFVLAGKLDEAKALHARHPLQASKAEILGRGKFENYGDFFFAVTDVFLNASVDQEIDQRWAPLFEADPGWKLTELAQTDVHSYRNFARGVLNLGRSNPQEGQRFLMLAARQRMDNFEKVSAANFEGLYTAGLVDKIVVAAGLAAAVKVGDRASIDLMIKGSELLGRNLRHRLVDVAALLGAQPDVTSRRNVHSYIHLVAKKREWEMERIRKLITKEAIDKGKLIGEYRDAITTLGKLKDRLGAVPRDVALPSLDRMQQRLAVGQAFVGYFQFIGGIGKYCIRRDQVAYAVTHAVPETMNHVHLLQEALTEGFTKPFPVASAIYLYDFMFGGLEACLGTDADVTVAPFPELASIPLGVLLRSAPPVETDSSDLRQARWLIRDFSFSTAISARHYLATTEKPDDGQIHRPLLAVGDPKLNLAKLASTESFRRSARTRNGLLDFQELPETADEVRAVAKLFGAADDDILLGERGTEEALRSRPLAEYDVIHFATHGLIKEELAGLSDSALLLTPGLAKDEYNDGLLTATEISRLSLAARLVVLSACNTARYDVSQASLSVQDLQAAFTIAGTPALLGTLWPVHSQTAQDLITAFFNEWRSGASKGAADALSKATRAFLDRTDERRQHPAYWAPFVVVGNGSMRGRMPNRDSEPQARYRVVQAYEAGGEIIHASRLGTDFLVSMIAEWDGQKMNGIISRRSFGGEERWRVGSRDVGAGRIAADKQAIYAIGFRTEGGNVPVARSFTMSGQLRWQNEFTDLPGYAFSDLLKTSTGLFVVASPRFPDSPRPIFLLSLNPGGQVERKVEVSVASRTSVFGPDALLALWNKKLIVAINTGSSYKFREEKKGVFGLPEPCNEGASTTIYELDFQNLRPLASRSVPNFRAAMLLPLGEHLFVGGDALERCSIHGVAAVLRLDKVGESHLLWQDNDLFTSSVRGLIPSDSGLLVAVGHERKIGIERSSREIGGSGGKRWGDNTQEQREGSLVHLTMEGVLVNRRYISAGLSVYLQGVIMSGHDPIAYGALGGMPAHTILRSAPPTKRIARKDSAKKKDERPWDVEILRDPY